MHALKSLEDLSISRANLLGSIMRREGQGSGELYQLASISLVSIDNTRMCLRGRDVSVVIR